LNLKKGDITYNVKGSTSTVCCKDKREVYLLKTCINSQALGHYVDKKGNAYLNLHILEFTTGIRVLSKPIIWWPTATVLSVRLGNGVGLLFYLVNLPILNAFIIHN
jgi:hypothetical protein